MPEILDQLYWWFGIADAGEILNISDMINFVIRAAVGCGFTVFFFKQIFNLVDSRKIW